MRRFLILTALALLVISPAAFGQAQRGSISVTVVDTDGGALPGATVSAESDQSLTRRTAISNATGEARLVAIDPATNYVVTVSLDGFSTARVEPVAVRAGQGTRLRVTLQLAEITEELIVTAESPLVDVTKTQAGQDITLQLTESLPTQRSYLGYLQLVPGVQDTLGDSDNPASRSGVNYRDADREGGDVGRSSDNLYYFDGINTTDRTDGIAGADLNTEIIQEQSVITGAIPAEFIGVPGLVSNVVTKSGGNQFSGSVSYYLQNDSLVESNKHFTDDSFSTFGTAVTLGGPIVRDKAWFFGSFLQFELERDVVNEEDVFLRTVTESADQGFFKATWAFTGSDVLSGTYLTDPTDRDGDFDRSRPNSADRSRERGGERWSLGYNRVWGGAALELAATDHEADRNLTPLNQAPRNDVSFAPGVAFTSGQASLGGSGTNIEVNRSTDAVRGSLEYLFDTGWGDHALKFGIVDSTSTLFENPSTTGSPPATYLSLSPTGGQILLCEIVGTCSDNPWSEVDFGVSTDEVFGFTEGLTAAQLATLLGLWDDNNNGILDQDEILNNMTFGSTSGNPDGLINYTRDLQTQAGISKKGSESTHYYIQDSWQWNKWSVNAGLRAEDTTFIADNGDDVGTWDTEVAPRISVSYDLKGDGRSSVGVFYGEYYDAFRDTAIDFAGSLTGRVIEEQVYVEALDDWVRFRFRGGTAVQDAFFAPRIATPVTEELQLQYKRDLGNNMMFEINLIDRETTDIGEDYGSFYYNADQYVNSAGGTLGGGPPTASGGTFFLGPQFFGFSSFSEIPTNLNFLIGTLPDGNFRDWQGLELVFRKRYSNNWQLLASLNIADAEGNSNSDANFDGAGDVVFLDPRAPNRTGTLPGLVEQLFKVHGSYNWDNGFQVGSSYRWNSGIILNRNGSQAFSRSLPDRVDVDFPFGGFPGGGFDDTWLAADALGFFDGRSYGVLDVRGAYVWTVGDMEVDFFLDVFNLLDNQDVIRIQDLVPGGDGFAFMEGITFVPPRRYFLGARLRF
ncbi:MAG: TonB-dependent receptor [Acidobacteria bacterium]|nr:TonB-dependent receptor [Acidobacteriota bacterium]